MREHSTPYLRACTGEAGIPGFCLVGGVRISLAVAIIMHARHGISQKGKASE